MSKEVPFQAQGAQPESKFIGNEDRKGSVTSVIALLLSLVVIALSVGAVIVPMSVAPADGVTDYGRLAISLVRGFATIMMSLAVMAPTVLVALRSASKPKGHVGRGRGIFSVIASVTFPVLCLGALSVFAFGQARSVMGSGLVAKTAPADDGSIRLVAPGNNVTISGDLASALDDLGLLPEQTIDEDGILPITAENGKVYVNGNELDPDMIDGILGTMGSISDEQLEDVARQIESLEKLGYSMGVDGNGQIVATDPNGNSVTLSTDEDGNLGIDASTTIDLNAISQMAEQFGVSLDGLFG